MNPPLRFGSLTLPLGAGLAPMAGITDVNTRLLAYESGCAWAVSEMLSAKGYICAPRNRATLSLIARAPNEGIAGLQLFGREPDYVYEAARALRDQGFQFLDFNMGCPAHKIVGNGEGSALMREPKRVAEIVRALYRGADGIPITVKMRAGWDPLHINAVEIARIAEAEGAAAVAVHPRTRDQMYMGHSDWNVIRDVKQAVHIPVIGNGDIRSGADALSMIAETGCDGVMIGRGAQGNPWIFKEIACALNGEPYALPSAETRIRTAIRHLQWQCEWRGERVAIPEMRKHISWYLRGFRNCVALREAVNHMDSRAEVEGALMAYLDTIGNENSWEGMQ